MKWKTKEQVKEAAKDKTSALQMSLEHHQQLRDCKMWELMKAIEEELVDIWGDYCACCGFVGEGGKKDCPLIGEKCTEQSECCGGEWFPAKEVFRAFKKDPTPTNIRAFQEAESKVCDFIQAVIDKEKEPKEVNVQDKFDNGDYGTGKHDGVNAFWIVAKNPSRGDGNVFLIKDGVYGGIWNRLTDVVKTGNALDDMNAKQEHVGETETLEEFEMDGNADDSVKVVLGSSISSTSAVIITHADVDVRFNADQFNEYISKLQKVANGIRSKK